MRNKTLFRTLLKLLGLWLALEGGIDLFRTTAWYLAAYVAGTYSASPSGWLVPSLFTAVAEASRIAVGLYLFFGGKWVADLAIPGNRPYCPEWGYDLTGATESRCPECGTAFSPRDVLPPSQK